MKNPFKYFEGLFTPSPSKHTVIKQITPGLQYSLTKDVFEQIYGKHMDELFAQEKRNEEEFNKLSEDTKFLVKELGLDNSYPFFSNDSKLKHGEIIEQALNRIKFTNKLNNIMNGED